MRLYAPKKEMRYKYLDKIDRLKVEIVYFGDNHGRDTESRQLPKITAQGENHGNHGDREFVIYIYIPTHQSAAFCFGLPVFNVDVLREL